MGGTCPGGRVEGSTPPAGSMTNSNNLSPFDLLDEADKLRRQAAKCHPAFAGAQRRRAVELEDQAWPLVLGEPGVGTPIVSATHIYGGNFVANSLVCGLVWGEGRPSYEVWQYPLFGGDAVISRYDNHRVCLIPVGFSPWADMVRWVATKVTYSGEYGAQRLAELESVMVWKP